MRTLRRLAILRDRGRADVGGECSALKQRKPILSTSTFGGHTRIKGNRQVRANSMQVSGSVCGSTGTFARWSSP